MLACLAACGSAERDRYTLYLHISADPGTLNPVTSTEAVASAVTRHVYESLLDRDDDSLELRPELAEKWQVSPDGMTYLFYLKKGVMWSDGHEFTADDVVYSYQRIKDPKVACAPLKVYYIDVRSVRKITKYQVEFSYSKPYYLALEICGTLPIVPKHIYDDGSDFNNHPSNRFPVGTGPYKFERWDTGKMIILSVNEKFRGAKPDIKRVVFKIVPESNVALQMLKKGEIDVMDIRPIQWVRQTDSEKFLKSFSKYKYYLPYYNYIGWNSRREMFRDRKVRLALTHMINREAILNKLLFGLGEIVTGTFYIYSENYSRDIKPWPYEPEKGRKLLAEAGWKDTDGDGILDRNGVKFSFTFTIPSGREYGERLATILKEDFSKAGIEMNINMYEWAVFVQKMHERDFDAVSVGWSLGYSGDPYQLWHSSQIKQGSNFCAFNNAEADRIIEDGRMEFNEKKRIGMYQRFNRIVHEEQPYTFMFCTPALAVVSKRFDNVKVHKKGLNYLEWKVRAVQ
jgi:peptide/nickel transport system substrate-binding protein